LYIDSNIFIFAAVDKGKLGKDCRNILKLIDEQEIVCAASFLVVDEVVWVLKRNIGKTDAVKITKAMLSMPIKWIDVTKSTTMRMIGIYEKTALGPRDAIHVASMKDVGISVIVSEDDDFDEVEGIERNNASEFIAKYL